MQYKHTQNILHIREFLIAKDFEIEKNVYPFQLRSNHRLF